MRGSAPLWHLLGKARRADLAAESAPSPVRIGQGVTRRRVLAALGAAAITPVIGFPKAARAQGGARVAIIGGGLAGLVALDRLVAAGIDARLYEARGRLGGRVLTANNAPEIGLDIEDGGNLINTDHMDMLALAERFKIGLIDRKPMTARNRYVVDGEVFSEGSLVADLGLIAKQIGADAAALDADYDGMAPKFDALSVTQYLDAHADKLTPPIRALIEATIRTEFGVEPGDASAIELMFNLPVVNGEQAELISLSDERFILKGGSSSVVRALSEPLMDRIETGKALISISGSETGLALRFADGSEAHADRVIVTVPAPLMRTIDYGDLLPESWRTVIAEIDSGRNEKINAGYAQRTWQPATGPAGAAWVVDTKGPGIFSEFWEASSGQPGAAGVLTYFFGGKQADALLEGQIVDMLRAAEAAVAPAVPGLKARTMRRTGWTRDPFSRGGYSNFKPGQLTRFAGHFWIEEDGSVAAPADAGPIIFAGEHLSDAFPGYMNGGAQTGRLAAEALIASLALPKVA